MGCKKLKMYRDNFAEYRDIASNLVYGDPCGGNENITFIIPTYKRPEKVRRAIYSILRQQTKVKYDIVVVDNEAELNTDTQKVLAKICEDNKNVFYYKNEENIGMFPNWNRCYELAKGEWCCILMSDDELKPDYLDRVVETQQKYHLDCVRVGSDIFDQSGRHVKEKSIFDKKYHNWRGHVQHIDKSYFIFRGALPPSGMFVKREAIIELGGYDPQFYPSSDFEMDTHLVTNFNVGMLWERLCITHTDDSASMRKEVIKQSIYEGYRINAMLTHNGKESVFLSAISNVKYYITIERVGLNKSDYEEIDYKWDKWIFKILYKVAYHINRIFEIVGLR